MQPHSTQSFLSHVVARCQERSIYQDRCAHQLASWAGSTVRIKSSRELSHGLTSGRSVRVTYTAAVTSFQTRGLPWRPAQVSRTRGCWPRWQGAPLVLPGPCDNLPPAGFLHEPPRTAGSRVAPSASASARPREPTRRGYAVLPGRSHAEMGRAHGHLYARAPGSTGHPQRGHTRARPAGARSTKARPEGATEPRTAAGRDSPAQREAARGRAPAGGGGSPESQRRAARLVGVRPRQKPSHTAPAPRDDLRPRRPPTPLTSPRGRHLGPAPPPESAAIPAASRPSAARVFSAIFACEAEEARLRRVSRAEAEPRLRPD